MAREGKRVAQGDSNWGEGGRKKTRLWGKRRGGGREVVSEMRAGAANGELGVEDRGGGGGRQGGATRRQGGATRRQGGATRRQGGATRRQGGATRRFRQRQRSPIAIRLTALANPSQRTQGQGPRTPPCSMHARMTRTCTHAAVQESGDRVAGLKRTSLARTRQRRSTCVGALRSRNTSPLAPSCCVPDAPPTACPPPPVTRTAPRPRPARRRRAGQRARRSRPHPGHPPAPNRHRPVPRAALPLPQLADTPSAQRRPRLPRARLLLPIQLPMSQRPHSPPRHTPHHPTRSPAQPASARGSAQHLGHDVALRVGPDVLLVRVQRNRPHLSGRIRRRRSALAVRRRVPIRARARHEAERLLRRVLGRLRLRGKR
jgi:hypothetical protein